MRLKRLNLINLIAILFITFLGQGNSMASGEEQVVTGEISVPMLTTTAYEWLTQTKIVEVKVQESTNADRDSKVIYFSPKELEPLLKMKKDYSEKPEVKAIVKVQFRKNFLGRNTGSKIEIVQPGFVPQPK